MARQPEPAIKRERGDAGAQPRPGWPSPNDIHALRQEHGFITPLAPIEPGKPYCVFAQAGIWEWLFHPADAEIHLRDGLIVDGKPCDLEIVGHYPLMGAVQIRASHPDRTATGFIADRQAA